MTIPSSKLAEYRAAEAAATRGPWRVPESFHNPPDNARYDDGETAIAGPPNNGVDDASVAIVSTIYYDGLHLVVRPADTAFIVMAREAVPALLDEIEQWRSDQITRDMCAEIDELRSQLAGSTGELLGTKVTAGFFQSRCEVLEKLLASKRLTEKEQDVLKGCCPLEHPPHVVCRGCGLSREDYEAEAARLAALR